MGPLPKTRNCNDFLLIVVDVTSHFPEASPLFFVNAQTIIEALVFFFSGFGWPKQVQHDQEINFVCGVS